MSQRAVFVRINGCLIPEVFSHVPEYDDFIDICKDYDYDDNNMSDYHYAEYEWVEIGDGESGMDDFIDDETLLHIYDSYDWEKEIYQHFGFDVNIVESGSEEIMFYDLKE